MTPMPLDTELMTRAVDNLLNNSVRHNPDGCSVTVRAHVISDSFVLETRDTGVGYPDDVLRCMTSPEAQNSSTLHLFWDCICFDKLWRPMAEQFNS